jgi:hypothetical protein
MSNRGAYTVADLPEGLTAIHCPKCGLANSFHRKTLLAMVGANVSLPEALVRLANCSRSSNTLDPCRVMWGASPSGTGT